MTRRELPDVAATIDQERDLCASAEDKLADRRVLAWRRDPWAVFKGWRG